MRIQLSSLERRVLDISYKKGLSHLSSCLTSVDIIDKTFEVMTKDDIFILSNGHAGLALYVVLEKHRGQDAEKLFDKHGVHPNRSVSEGIYCSAGSLGSAITIAVGMALADRKRLVYVMMSDGELAEGSCWEALRIAGDLRLENLRIMVNANGTGAYGKIDDEILDRRLQLFYPSLVFRSYMYKYPDYLQGYDGHYKVLSEQEYKEIIGEE